MKGINRNGRYVSRRRLRIVGPKGGGVLRGTGDKFAANPVTGTGSLNAPIFTSPGGYGFGREKHSPATPAPGMVPSDSVGLCLSPRLRVRPKKACFGIGMLRNPMSSSCRARRVWFRFSTKTEFESVTRRQRRISRFIVSVPALKVYLGAKSGTGDESERKASRYLNRIRLGNRSPLVCVSQRYLTKRWGTHAGRRGNIIFGDPGSGRIRDAHLVASFAIVR